MAPVTSSMLRLDLFARLGYSVKGVLYGVIGVLALQAAVGLGGRVTNDVGAVRAILRQPFGRTMLLVIAVGLFGYATWRTLEGFMDSERQGNGLKALAFRGSYIVRGLLHGYLGSKVLELYRGFSVRGNSEEQLVAETFTWPLGEWMVILGGLGLLTFAAYQIYRAATRDLGLHFDVEGLRRDAGEWAVTVCRAGMAARGLVFAVVAWYLIQAGISGRASDTADKADAMRVVANWPEPLGTLLLAAMGAGLLAYGAFQVLNAKYRAIA
jgi:hypothetical protein